jgi:hypothetical protein
MVGDLPPDALQGGNAAVGADGAEGAHGSAGKALHGAEHVPVRLLLGRIHQAIRRSGAPTYVQMSAIHKQSFVFLMLQFWTPSY